MKRKLRGPFGLTIELNQGEVFPLDPGQGTPAMVYRNKGLCDECSGTYWCVTDTGEFISTSGDGEAILTPAELQWLEAKRTEVDDFLKI